MHVTDISFTIQNKSIVAVLYQRLNYGRGCPVFASYSETFGVAFLKAFFELLRLLAGLCKNDSNADFSRHQVRIWNAIEKKMFGIINYQKST